MVCVSSLGQDVDVGGKFRSQELIVGRTIRD